MTFFLAIGTRLKTCTLLYLLLLQGMYHLCQSNVDKSFVFSKEAINASYISDTITIIFSMCMESKNSFPNNFILLANTQQFVLSILELSPTLSSFASRTLLSSSKLSCLEFSRFFHILLSRILKFYWKTLES